MGGVGEPDCLMPGLSIARRRGLARPIPTTVFGGTHLGDAMASDGDQVVILEDGFYDAANIVPADCAHAATGGIFNGWLIIAARNKGGAVIDLSSSGMALNTKSPTATGRDFRIMFVGLKFSNGEIRNANVRKLRFWHTEHTFPYTAWQSQYEAAGGTAGTLNIDPVTDMANSGGTAIRNYNDVTINSPNYGNYVSVYGAYIHNMAEDGIYYQGFFDCEVRGTRIVDCYHHTYSPSDYFHSDGMQFEWGARIYVTDSYIGSKIQFESYNSNLDNIQFGAGPLDGGGDNWYGGSHDLGMIYDTAPSGIQRDITDCYVSGQWFNNGQYKNGSDGDTASPTYNASWDIFQLGFGDPPTGLTFNLTHSTPAGVTVSSGLITDHPNLASVVNHASNPANLWLAANPYSSWPAYFAGNWP